MIGDSPLLHFNTFDFIHGIPTEYMHSVCLGLVKRLVELCFQVAPARTRVTTRRLSSPDKFNANMSNVAVPREFSRRCRKMDFAVLKAQEFRNIILFFFPLIIDSFEKTAKENQLWLLLAFSLRSCIIPEPEYNPTMNNLVSNCMQKFYTLYESLFGVQNCTYTTHIICCHLLDMRLHGPLTVTSAFIFEAFYGELRQSFTPGTTDPLKQIFQKILIGIIFV